MANDADNEAKLRIIRTDTPQPRPRQPMKRGAEKPW